jgi:F-type H+-transporting ATPase subunit delta
MATASVIARPYAKAIFEHALEAKSLEDWSRILDVLSMVASDPAALECMANPSVEPAQIKSLLLAPLAQDSTLSDVLQRWVDLIVDAGREDILPEIKNQFDLLRAEHEQTLDVNVQVFEPMTAHQEGRLIEKLSQKLQRKVSIQVEINPSIMGGILIQAGDFVMDGSVKGKIAAMQAQLEEA